MGHVVGVVLGSAVVPLVARICRVIVVGGQW